MYMYLTKTNQTTIAVEIKNKERRINQSFTNRYPEAKMSVLSKDTFWV